MCALILAATMGFVHPPQVVAPEPPTESKAGHHYQQPTVNRKPNPYCHLPSEQQCEAMYQATCAAICRLNSELNVAAGWRRSQLIDQQDEMTRAEHAAYAAWWVTWRYATDDQRDEWFERLCIIIGPDAAWAGELPEVP
jgi:hypothetical protein